MVIEKIKKYTYRYLYFDKCFLNDQYVRHIAAIFD